MKGAFFFILNNHIYICLRNKPLDLFQKLGYIDSEGNLLPEVKASLKTIAQGASTTVWCATNPMLKDLGGIYCENVEVAHLSSDISIIGGVKSYSLDENNAKRLWKLSEKMTGVRFTLD